MTFCALRGLIRAGTRFPSNNELGIGYPDLVAANRASDGKVAQKRGDRVISAMALAVK
jgi:hypothetical protein